MLPKRYIKEQTKYSVYTHLFSCIAIVLLSSLIPTLVSSVALNRVMSSVSLTVEDLDLFMSGTLDESSGVYVRVIDFVERYFKAQLITLFATFINLPFQYSLVRYFLVLAGTPADKTCSFRVFFSATENIKAFSKGAVLMLIISVLSGIGIVVGYFPVYLTYCMAPFYLATSSEPKVLKALSQSRKLMSGNRADAFLALLEFILIRAVAFLLSLMGLSLFAVIIEIVGTSLFYTALAVIFVRLDSALRKKEQQ